MLLTEKIHFIHSKFVQTLSDRIKNNLNVINDQNICDFPSRSATITHN